jgi:hypothetical protein
MTVGLNAFVTASNCSSRWDEISTLRDRRLPPPLKWIISSSGLIRGVRRFETDVSGLRILTDTPSTTGPTDSSETSDLNRLAQRNKPANGIIKISNCFLTWRCNAIMLFTEKCSKVSHVQQRRRRRRRRLNILRRQNPVHYTQQALHSLQCEVRQHRWPNIQYAPKY